MTIAPPPFEPFTFFQRRLLGHALHSGGDILPPPTGYSSWDEYYALNVRGGPLTTFAPPAGIPRGRKATMAWTRDGEDVATIGMHFLHRDGSDVTDFTDADSAILHGLMVDLWNAIKAHFTATIQLDRITWHDFGVGIRRPNPAVEDNLIVPASAGTHIGTDPLPPQCATSVTFKTSQRKNWGRVYLPATVEGNVTEGRFISDYVDDVRTAFGTLLDAAATHNTPAVVWCPRHDGALLQFFKAGVDHPESAHALGLDNPDSSSFARTVDQVQVDDLVDIVRSRRFGRALIRSTHTLP